MAAVGQEADTLDAEDANPVAKLELVPQAFTGAEDGTEVQLLVRVEGQVYRTSGQRIRAGKAVWLDEHHFTFEAFTWRASLEVQALSLTGGQVLGSTSLEFLSLTPGRWHVLKEKLCGSGRSWSYGPT
ncbi:unnamed protein product [Effrenium voratum]|uniref:Uncharacterized protein n=1 Tax=Effrenium voratum TaxID=2562239 RepID=A0AA36HQB6_9DINO|nr:unnamed protein product [Effrenium voratum]